MNPFKVQRDFKITYRYGLDGIRHELNLSKPIALVIGAFFVFVLVLAMLYLININNWKQANKTLTKIQNENIQLRKKLDYYSGVIDTIYQKLDTLNLLDSKTKSGGVFYPYYKNDEGLPVTEDTFVYDSYLDTKVNNIELQIQQITTCLQWECSISLAMVPTSNNDLMRIDNGPSIYPTFGRISDGWGTRIHPFYDRLAFHYGLDFANKIGTPIYATSDGEIILTGYDPEYGKLIKIKHANNFETRYGHLYNFQVSIGDKVRKGQIIAFMGSTGMSTGPHLHYEVIQNGIKVNPANYLNRVDDAVYYAKNE